MKSKKQIQILIGILVVLVGIIILLLMRSCQKQPEGPNKVLAPDYPSMDVDKNADKIPDDESTKADVSQGGGSVTISFTDNVKYSLGTALSTYTKGGNKWVFGGEYLYRRTSVQRRYSFLYVHRKDRFLWWRLQRDNQLYQGQTFRFSG